MPTQDFGWSRKLYMRYATWLAIMGITTISFTIRFILLDRYPAPPSSDFGNYLTIVHILEGHDVTGFGLRYPPLFFAVLAPLISLLGPMLALKVAAAGAAASSCIPMFLLAKRWSNYPAAIAVTFMFTFSQAMAEMTAWGGSPNFLAITFMLSSLYFLDRAFSPTRSYLLNGIATGVFVGLVFETHHLTALVLAAIIGLFFVLVAIWETKANKKKGLKILVLAGVSAFAVSLPGLPAYFRIQSNLSASLGGYGPASLESMIGPAGFGRIAGPYWFAWAAIFIVGGATIALMMYYSRSVKTYKIILASSILAPLLLAAFVVGEAPGRVIAFLPIPLLLGFGMFIVGFARWARSLPPAFHAGRTISHLVVALFVADVLVISAVGIQWTSTSVDWYHPIEPGDMAALNWVKKNTPSDAVFATSGKILGGAEEGDRLGWWIEGYAERTAYMVGSAQYRLFKDELQSTQDMNRFFAGTNVVENGMVQIADEYPLFYRGNPEISFYHFGRYDPLLFLNDGTNEVKLALGGSTYYTETMLGAQRTPLLITNSTSSITLSTLSTTPNYRFERSTVVTAGSRSVEMFMHLQGTGSTPVTSMTIKLWPQGKTFADLGVVDGMPSFDVEDNFGNKAMVSVEIRSSGTSVDQTLFTVTDPVWHLPMIAVEFGGLDEFDIRFVITPEEVAMEPLGHLMYTNGYEILKSYGVDYLFVSTSMGNQVERFQKDSAHFRPVYSGTADVIFRVTLG